MEQREKKVFKESKNSIYTILKKIMPHGMANKLFVVILYIGAFLILSLSITVTALSKKLLYSYTTTILDNQATQIVNTFDNYIEILKNTVMTTSRQNSIRALIFRNYDEYGSYLVYRDSYAYLKNIHEFYNWIHIYIFVKDINYTMSSNPSDITGNYIEKGIPRMEWYKQVERNIRDFSMISNFVPPVSSREEKFACVLRVRDISKWENYGYIIATIDKTVLKGFIKGTSFEDKGFMLVLDSDSKIAYCSERFIGNLNSKLQNVCEKLKSKNGICSVINKDYYYYAQNSKTTGWRFILFTDKKYVDAQILNFQVSVIIIALITILLLIIIARLTSKGYIKPITKLIDFIHEIEKREFAGQIDLKAEDEVGTLIQSFNSMIASVRQNQILRKKAHIYVLQKQINPHFLFNTFASIKSLAQQNDTKGVISMIEKLSDIFYYNINPSGDYIAKVKDEILHVQNYIDIQRVRFGDRISVLYQIDKNTLEYIMPRMILQPIVENSISYGLENMKKGYQLQIIVGFEENDIIFIIRDNGKGIPPDKLSRLLEYIYNINGTIQTEEFGIGLKNIHERLYLLYGNNYGITIKSEFGEYTEIKVRIPKNEVEKFC